MKVNDKDFTIYNADNKNTVIERIAANLKGIPYWIDLDGADVMTADSVTAVNVLEDLRVNVGNFSSFSDIEARYAGWIGSRQESERDPLAELATMFVVYYVDDDSDGPVDFTLKVLLEDMFRDAGGADFDWNFIEDALNKRRVVLSKIRTDVRENENRARKKEEEMKKMGGRVEGLEKVEISPFKTESVATTLEIETENPVMLSHVFENVRLDESNVLFVRFKNFFKVNPKSKYVFEKYDYDTDSDENFQIVYYSYTANRRVPEFTEIKMKNIPGNLQRFTVEIDKNENFEYSDVYSIIEMDYKVLSTKKTNVKGNFTLLNVQYHRELFLDEIMNNEQFFSLYANERKKVTKIFTKLHLYYYTYKTGLISFSLSNENDGLRIRISSMSGEDKLQYFVDGFTNLFQVYKSREKMLFNIYKKYIPTIVLPVEIKPRENTDYNPRHPLAREVPSLFLPLYTRKCAKPPRIVSADEDVGDLTTMEYPLRGEGNLEPKRYVCDQTGNFKWPGLRRNTLDNRNVFEYIPCCYETNQEERKGSLWNAYYKGNVNKNEKYDHIIYKTSRVLPNEGRGSLPSGLSQILGANSTRRGVFVGPNAFIDCVSRATNTEDNYYDDPDKRAKILRDIRARMSPEICAQENWDALNSYTDWFSDPSTYFEPRRFFRAVEDYFQANVYVFERSIEYIAEFHPDGRPIMVKGADSPNGILSIPNAPPRGSYLDGKKYKKFAFVYVHYGAATNNLDYPHCEYIILDRAEDRTAIEKNVENVYRNVLIFSKKYNIEIPKTVGTVTKQYLDSAGRCIAVKLDNNDKILLSSARLPGKYPFSKIINKITKTPLADHVNSKRMARIFVEYCMIKYANSTVTNVRDFIENCCKIVPGHEYSSPASKFEIEYYDEIFKDSLKNYIIFDSEDTAKRIEYSMKILEKRNGLAGFKNESFIHSYHENVLDFTSNENMVVFDETSFKTFAYGPPRVVAFNNSIEIPTSTTVILRNKSEPELNGYFVVFQTLDECLKNAPSVSDEDRLYVWHRDEFEHYVINTEDDPPAEKRNRIIFIYKIDGVANYLAKFSNF